MDTPQLSFAVSSKSGSGVKHGKIVTHQDVSFLPFEPQANPPIVQQIINGCFHVLCVVFYCDVAGRELGLRGGPRLVPAHTGGVQDGMADHQREVLEMCVPEAIIFHTPRHLL